MSNENPDETPVPNSDSRAPSYGKISLYLSGFSTLLVMAAFFTTHSDRSTSRVPILTYHGPLAALMPGMAYVATATIVIAYYLAMAETEERDFGTSLLGYVSLFVATVVATLGFFAFTLHTED